MKGGQGEWVKGRKVNGKSEERGAWGVALGVGSKTGEPTKIQTLYSY